MLMLIVIICHAPSDSPGYSHARFWISHCANQNWCTGGDRDHPPRSTITIMSILMLFLSFPWLFVLRITSCAQRSDEWIPHLLCYRRPCLSLSDFQGPQDHSREIQRAKGSQRCHKSPSRYPNSSPKSSDSLILYRRLCCSLFVCAAASTEHYTLTAFHHSCKNKDHSPEKWINPSSKNAQKLQIECSVLHPTWVILEFCDSPSLHLDQTKRLRYSDPTLAE